MYADVGTPVERSEDIAAASESVVHHHADALPVSHLYYRLEIRHIESRIPEDLEIDRLGAGIDQLLQVLAAVAFREPHFYAHVSQGNLEHGESPSVKERRSHDIVARAAYICHRQENGGLHGSRGHSRHPAFEGGHPLLEHLVGSVRDTGIDVPRFLQGKKVGPVLHIVKHIRSGLVYRYCSGFRHGIYLLACPELQCLESIFFLLHDQKSVKCPKSVKTKSRAAAV